MIFQRSSACKLLFCLAPFKLMCFACFRRKSVWDLGGLLWNRQKLIFQATKTIKFGDLKIEAHWAQGASFCVILARHSAKGTKNTWKLRNFHEKNGWLWLWSKVGWFETTSFPISGDPRRNPMFFVPGWGSMKKIGPTSTGLKLLEFLKKTQRLGSFQIKKMFSHMAVSKNRGTHKMDGL